MHRLPSDSYIWSADGPRMVRDLEVSQLVAVVDRHGRVVESSVTSLTAAAKRPVVNLLTTAGELVLDFRAVLTTRGGREFASAVARQVSAGAGTRVELALPGALPAASTVATEQDAVRSALASFDSPLIRVPASLGLHDDVDHYLRSADIAYRDASDERWTAFAFDSKDIAVENGSVAPAEARILSTLTAWEATDGELTSRTTLEQRALRSRLLAAMAAAGRPGAVRWVPAYGPVEARISSAQPSSFATIKGVFTDVASCTELETSDVGSVVLGLAIIAGTRPDM